MTEQTFTFNPDNGYEVSDVLVDGKSIGAKGSYTFKDVDAQLTILGIQTEMDTALIAVWHIFTGVYGVF